MSILAAMLPIGAAAKVASSLFSRRPDRPAQGEFQQVLQQTLGAKVVAQRDADGDGLLTLDEFSGDAKRFAYWDSNGDGKLSAVEIDAGVRLNGQWTKLDSNRDGALSQHELGVTQNVFNAMDRDHDRRVGRAEYFGSYQGGRRA